MLNPEKTTVRVYWGFLLDIGFFHDYFRMNFYGYNSESLNKLWHKKVQTLEKKEKQKQLQENAKEIEETVTKLNNTPWSFFSNKRKILEEELTRLRLYKPRGLSGFELSRFGYDFLSKYELVLISESNEKYSNATIYEIYDRKN